MIRHVCNKNLNKSQWIQQQLQQRCSYHSEKGVFGYRPKRTREYKVAEDVLQSRNAQGNVYRWVEAYRKYGHKLAAVNPISIRSQQSSLDELNPAFYGLQNQDNVQPQGLLHAHDNTAVATMTVGELEAKLKEMYCGKVVSAELGYVENLEEREWLALHFEKLTAESQQYLSNANRKQIADLLIKSQAWDSFMAKKFPTVKRYGGEGAESLLAFFWQLLRNSVQDDLQHIIVAMPHRGRTELQTILLNMRPAKVFHKLSGESEFPDDCQAMSDVISHFHTSEEVNVEGKSICLNMVRNPSHLEAANAVAMGKTRSKQQTLKDGAFSASDEKPFGSAVLNVILHGDAAFAGQGINQECLNMAYVPHFEIGGSIHLIVNNQVGFTTPGERGRSTDYSSDLAKTIQAPVFHVNGDDPEMVALITKLACEYQHQFRKDVFIDMNCFRRWGHNELDDPTFTNPLVYAIVNKRKTVPDLYAEKLNAKSILSVEESQKLHNDYTEYLSQELLLASEYKPQPSYFQKQWQHLTTASDNITYWDTGLDYGLLNYIGQQSVKYPEGFNVHPHLKKTHIEGRIKKLNAGENIDWSTAEALAMGSLMYQGYNVRLSGEDVGRGTFSHRHVMLVDQATNEMFIPLNDLKGGHDGKLEVAHSILSEEAVLAYEYGMAIDNPNNLIIWEAQFGDFANGAQIIIDNFIISGETKWMESNGLVLLLPHGYDGAASEHSSCRIERFLQLCDSKECDAADSDNVNVQIINPTTPAQYFHSLRRQQIRNFRKPLIVAAPKVLLRLSAATSVHTDFESGTSFHNVLGDDTVRQEAVKRIILCSGKHYYNLVEERLSKNVQDTALIRVESLCPFPVHELQQEIAKYENATKFVWAQEEHRNMGAWSFVRPRFENFIGKQLEYCGRAEAATGATGIGKVHKREVEEIVQKPFKI